MNGDSLAEGLAVVAGIIVAGGWAYLLLRKVTAVWAPAALVFVAILGGSIVLSAINGTSLSEFTTQTLLMSVAPCGIVYWSSKRRAQQLNGGTGIRP